MLKLMSDLIFRKSCSGTTFFRLDFLNYEKKDHNKTVYRVKNKTAEKAASFI